MEVFWMVFVEGRSGPTTCHSDCADAHQEAERLCEKESRKAYVLQVIGVYEKKVVEYTPVNHHL